MTSTDDVRVGEPSTKPLSRARDGSARGLITAHPLLSFFVGAAALSWLAWLPYVLSLNGIGVWSFRFPAVLGSSQLLGVLPGAYLGPVTAALVVTAVTDGRAGVRAWGARLFRWRVAPRWYAITLLGVPVAMVATGAVFSGGQIVAPSTAAVAAFVPMLMLQLVTTGLAEEPGWRDFALPRLQARFSPMGAAMVLGPVWGVWHLPLFVTEWGGYPTASWTHPVAFMVFCVSFNVVMSWVFNATGQSLPLSMLMHVGVNTFATVMWKEMFPSLSGDTAMVAMAAGATVAAAGVIVGTHGRLGLGNPHPDTPSLWTLRRP